MPTPTSSVAQFKFQPEKIAAGTVYHYVKSNIDGSYPAQIYIRLVDEENLDVWKFEAHNADAAHVTAHMDWETFSADRLESWVVMQDGSSRRQASMQLSRPDATLHVQLREATGSLAVGHFPVHIYNFDFISLNAALRHWTQPEGEVTFGVVQPNFDPERDSLLNYEGIVTLRYICDEGRQDQPCRRYEIGGEGLRDHIGAIWVHRTAGHIEDMEIPIADNPDWDDFKFRLVSVDIMDSQVWERFLGDEIQKLNPLEP